MYERFPLDYIGITDKFGPRIDPITGVTTYHYGIDFGWNKYQGEPVYSIYNSKVVYSGYDNSLGNYIILSYDKGNNTIICRFLHLREKSNLKAGDKVLRGQKVGNMGTTGYSTGVHLHFEYWICPKGYKYNYADRSKYAKNPLNYVYLFDDQRVSDSSKNDVIRVVGTSLIKKRDENKNQIEVVSSLLRCRTDAGTNKNILGYIDFGIYDVLDVKDANGYKWYKIDNEKWVANADNSLKVYNKVEEEMEEEDNSNEEQEVVENNNFDLNNYNEFISQKDGYYYIYLKKDEKIYYPK